MYAVPITIDNFSESSFLGSLLRTFTPVYDLGTKVWAETNRWLTSEVSSRQGKMDCMLTPWMLYVMECLDNPKIGVIVAKKSAQIGWTETINSFIGLTIDKRPKNIIVAFSRRASAIAYYKEKLEPFINSVPVLSEKVGIFKSTAHISFRGGYIKLITTGSIGDMKSSVASILIVEEPDDSGTNRRGQGNSISVFTERMKSFTTSKLIYGGTPTNKESSQVEIAYSMSNRHVYMVPCHKCGDFHGIDIAAWDNLQCDTYQDRKIDEVYGKFNPETAYYTCPHCKEVWTFEQKNSNVLAAVDFFKKGWQITEPTASMYGFKFNELMSSFTKSSFVELARKRCIAEHEYSTGNPGKLIVFVNNSQGEGYIPPQIGIDIEVLKKKRMNYPEGIIPYQGLILTAGIDVQRNRLAIVVRAWGRSGNSWLIHWGEIFGNTMDSEDRIWERLSDFLAKKWPHSSSDQVHLTIQLAAIDCADGFTTQPVYSFVRDQNTKYSSLKAGKSILAVHGFGHGRASDLEIYNEPLLSIAEPSTFEHRRRTLAETMGVTVFTMGSHRAHSEVMRRILLTGNTDRFYHTHTAYGRYEEGMLSCYQDTTGIFKKKASADKEVVDCEKLCLFGSYALGIRNYTDANWNAIENAIITKRLV